MYSLLDGQQHRFAPQSEDETVSTTPYLPWSPGLGVGLPALPASADGDAVMSCTKSLVHAAILVLLMWPLLLCYCARGSLLHKWSRDLIMDCTTSLFVWSPTWQKPKKAECFLYSSSNPIRFSSKSTMKSAAPCRETLLTLTTTPFLPASGRPQSPVSRCSHLCCISAWRAAFVSRKMLLFSSKYIYLMFHCPLTRCHMS